MSSGVRNKPLYKLAQLIAASATFQALIAAAYGVAATFDNALAHVHILEAIDKDGEHERPRAIVNLGTDFSYRKIGTGTWADSGTVELTFEFLPADPTAMPDANLLAFAELTGTILDECIALAGQGDSGDGETYLDAREWTANNGPPDFVDMQAQGGVNYLVDQYAVRWGSSS